MLQNAGDTPTARNILTRAVGAASDLVQRDPGNREDRLNLGLSRVWFANLLETANDHPEAIYQRKLAEEIYEKLVAESPNDSKVLDAQVGNWAKFGDLLAKQKKWKEAQRYYTMALGTAEPLSRNNPAFAEYVTQLHSSSERAAQALAKRP